MKLSTAFIVGALTALVTAQEVTFDAASGTFICPTASGIYCAGDSLSSDIIIRCENFVGQPGRCSNNLVGQPPFGTNPARCYASATQDAVAACEKNCIVYGSSGNTGADFSLPGCVPYFETSTTASASNPTLGTTISSASVSNPTLGTTISSSFSVSLPTLGTTISGSNPILTVTASSYSASNPVPSVQPPIYNYNTTLTRSSTTVTYGPPDVPTTTTIPGTTLTYAPPIVPTTATLPETTITYIPPPIPTTVTFPDTTYTYGPQPPAPTSDAQPSLTLNEPTTTIVYTNPTLSTFICSRTAGDFGCGGGGAGTGTTFGPGPTGGGGNGGNGGNGDGNGGGNGGGSGNGTYTVPSPTQTGETGGPGGPGATNYPTSPSTSPPVPTFTGAAATNAAGFGLAILGLAAAFAL